MKPANPHPTVCAPRRGVSSFSRLFRVPALLRCLFLTAAALLASGPVFAAEPAHPTPAAAAPAQAEWTVMVYLDGDNNLEYAALMDMLEMEQAIPENVEVIVLLDRHKGHTDILGDWTGTRLYRVRRAPPFDLKEAATGKPGPLPQALASDLLEDWGEADMSDPATLTRFIKTAASRFPARRYALVPWNHGGGWPGMLQDEDGGQGRPGKGMMTIAEFVQAAKAGAQALPRGRFDLLKFELCLMGQLDVLAEAAQVADHALASPPEEPAQGSDYLGILPLFRADVSTEALTRRMVDVNIRYYTNLGRAAAFSAYDLSRMRDVTTALKNLTDRLRPLAGSRFRELTRVTCFSTHYENLMADLKRGKSAFSSVELADWLDRLEHEVPDAPRAEIQALREQVRGLVAHTAATPNIRECRGLTLYIPLRREYERTDYRATAFAKDSGMTEYLAALYTAQDMLGKTDPQVSNVVMGMPRLKPGRDGRSATDFDIEPLQSLTPFSRNVVRFDVTGVGILMTKVLRFEQRGDEYHLNCEQLLVDSEKRAPRSAGGNVFNEISPDYNDGTTTFMREVSVKYKVSNGQALGDITIENVSASRNLTENVSVGYGLYRDGTTGGQDLLVQLTFSNVMRVPIKVVGFQLDAQGRPAGMRGVSLRPDGQFRPGVTVLDRRFQARRVFGPPMPLTSGTLLLTVDMLDEGTRVGNIIQVQTMNGRTAHGVSPVLPVRLDPSHVAMRANALQNGGANLPGRYAMIQFAASGTEVNALPTFQTLEFISDQPVSRWVLRDGEREKAGGPMNWLPYGMPQIALHRQSALSGLPLGETVQDWYALLSGSGPQRVWYCIDTGVGTRWAFVPLDQYSGDPLEGVWVSQTERWEFQNGRVRLTRDGRTGAGSYSLRGHIARMTGMPADEYAIYPDKKQGRLTLMSRRGAASILTREGGGQSGQGGPAPGAPTPERQIGQALSGRWLSGPETGNARLTIQPLPDGSAYRLRLLSAGQGETVCDFTINAPGGELLAVYPDGSRARIRASLSGNSLTLYFPRMPEIRFTRQ